MKTNYTQDELVAIMQNIPDRKGWNFSYMKTKSQPVPWDYTEIVKKYLSKEDTVLDIGTGGGEKFSALSEYFKEGVAVDVDEEMIRVANEKRPENVTYVCDDEHLEGVEGNYSVVLNRHAPYDLRAIASKLQTGGYFITQQVGEKNMRNIIETIGTPRTEPVIAENMFEGTGLKVIAFMEYNIDYRVLDIESLLFWLNALDYLHAGFDSTIATDDAVLLNKVLEKCVDGESFLTNEHRFLVIAQKA
jgi:SAM-dependent methyltransferase